MMKKSTIQADNSHTLKMETGISKPTSYNEALELLMHIQNENIRLRKHIDEISGRIVNDTNLSTPSILIVDDVYENIMLIDLLLKHDNYHIDKASSGFEALDKIQLHDYSLILMDIQMPEMDGLTTVREIRKLPQGKGIPVIFITAIYSKEELQQQISDLEGIDFITKPIIPKIFQRKIALFTRYFKQKQAIIEEINKREAAEKSLKESQTKYRTLVEHANAGIMIIDNNNTIIFANEFSQRLFFIAENNFIGKDIRSIMPNECYTEFINLIQNTRKTRKTSTIFIDLTFNNSHQHYHIRSIPMPHFDQYKAVIQLYITDQTEIQRTRAQAALFEIRYHNLFNSVPAGLFQMNTEGVVHLANRAFENILIPSIGNITYPLNILDYIAEEDEKTQLINSLKCNTALNSFPLNLGDKTSVLLSLSTRHEKSITKERLFDGVLIDITNRRQMEQELRSHRNNLEKKVLERTHEISLINSKLLQEISQHKQTANKLKNSQDNFRALVESVNDWIWEIDINGIYTYSSPRVKQLLGYLPQEIVGKNVFDLMHISCRNNAKAEYVNISNVKLPLQNLENTMIHKNGTLIYLETSGVPIYDENGTYKGYRGVDRDISDRKRMELMLRNSQLKLSLHLQQTSLGYIEWDLNREVLDWNPTVKQIFGYTKAEAMMNNTFQRIIPKKSRKRDHEIWKTIVANKQSVKTINANLTKNRHIITCEWHHTPITDQNGEVIGVSSLVKDVTKEVIIQYEQRLYKELIKNAPCAIMLVNDKLEFIHYNDKAGQILGLNESATTLHQSLKIHYASTSFSQIQTHIQPFLTSHKLWMGNLKFVDKEGTTQNVHHQITSLTIEQSVKYLIYF